MVQRCDNGSYILNAILDSPAWEVQQKQQAMANIQMSQQPAAVSTAAQETYSSSKRARPSDSHDVECLVRCIGVSNCANSR